MGPPKLSVLQRVTAPVGNGWRTVRPFVAEWGPQAVIAVGAFVVLASAAWAFAFTRIYTRPVSRTAATLWIYQNVPKGSHMANEHWDDPLPFPMPNFDHGAYAGPQLPLYDPDEPKKIEQIVTMLSGSDYINITSNRLYGSIPRIPLRYPMTTEYYRALFAGRARLQAGSNHHQLPAAWAVGDQ